ncbi:MAG: DUF349 domain-containing protein [Rubrivivax sp.]|nr:DUF349 domain-containing protein [Rubrivivax sp.]
MLSWLFKKRGPAAAPATPAPARGGKSATARQAAVLPAAAAAPAPVPVDEGPLLRAALGDDAALLRLAQSAQTLATKLAAVEALVDEGALRQAERAFRSHDRKVHRLAKQRLEAAVTRRESQAQAQALLERTRGLMAEALVPVNHVVEIDRAWAALPVQALTPELQQAQTTLRAELDAHMRAQEEAQRRLQRWLAEARQQLDAVPREMAATEHGGAQEAAGLAAQLAEALATLRASRPDVPATAALDAALDQARQAAVAQQTRLERLAEDAAAAAAEAPAVVADVAPDAEPPSTPSPKDEARIAAQGQRLEGLVQQAEAALAEGQLAMLQQRLQAIESALARGHAAPPEALRPRLQALQAERGRLKAWQQWGGARARDDLVAEAEVLARQTLAAAPPLTLDTAAAPEALHGPLVPQAPQLPQVPLVPVEPRELHEPQEIETAPTAPTAPTAQPPSAPETGETGETDSTGTTTEPVETIETIETRENAAVAATTGLPETPATPATPPAPTTAKRPKPPRLPPPVKLNLKQHAEAIQSLRKRWKALDHQGAVASAEQWRRFDAALQLAHEPVAVQQAALKAARQDNLSSRDALLSALEAWALAHAAAAAADTPTDSAGDDAGSPPPDWRACIAELDRFHNAWRKLGPVEHTVPAAARDTLLQRLNAALARVEGPLQQARATAAAEREQLIVQAEHLLPPAGGRPAPEATRQVRELQAAWQDHARRLPLPRGLETSLWARFRAATDAVFAQREAAFAARDAELANNLAAANALVDRLVALDVTTPAAEIRRTLAEVDRAWRQGGELPRGAVDALEARFHGARSAADALLKTGQQQRWLARCDALAARLALCEARDDRAADSEALAALDTRWAASDALVAALPAPWQLAMAQRWAQPPGAGPLGAAEVDELLLRLEAALNLPTAPAWQAARQQLKLRALKDTMEGRTPLQGGPQQHAGWLQALLRQAGLDAAQRGRLQALLAALRNVQPAVLGLPAE